jgi:hypothetical protein
MERALERSLLEGYMSETYLESLFGGRPSDELVGGLGTVLEAVSGKKYALAGALAVRAYVRLRPTFDADFLIDSTDAREAVRVLLSKGFQVSATPGLIGEITTLARGRFVTDLIVPTLGLSKEALASAVDHEFGERKIRVAPRDHLAAIKFFVGLRLGGADGAKHLLDARALIGAGADIRRVTALVRREDPSMNPGVE